MTSPGRAVLVSGASKGIGLASVLDLDRHGFRVFAGVRTDDDAAALRDTSDGRIEPTALDVTDPDEIARAGERIAEATDGAGLWGLVNNAGAVYPGPLEYLPIDALRQQLEVNVVGAVALTQACLPALRVAHGRIVNISSVNGRIVSPISAAYAASKFALEAVSDGFRRELLRVGAGVKVVVIQPGAIQTPIWATSRDRALLLAERFPPEAGKHYPRLADALRQSRTPPQAVPPERVAVVIRRALTARRPRTRYRVGWDARVGVLLAWLLPDAAVDRILSGRLRRREHSPSR